MFAKDVKRRFVKRKGIFEPQIRSDDSVLNAVLWQTEARKLVLLPSAPFSGEMRCV